MNSTWVRQVHYFGSSSLTRLFETFLEALPESILEPRFIRHSLAFFHAMIQLPHFLGGEFRTAIFSLQVV
jgi:hypothetical protein